MALLKNLFQAFGEINVCVGVYSNTGIHKPIIIKY